MLGSKQKNHSLDESNGTIGGVLSLDWYGYGKNGNVAKNNQGSMRLDYWWEWWPHRMIFERQQKAVG